MKKGGGRQKEQEGEGRSRAGVVLLRSWKRGEHLPYRRLSRLTRRGAPSRIFLRVRSHTQGNRRSNIRARANGAVFPLVRTSPRCVAHLPTYLPTYLLTNLPAAYGFSLPAQSTVPTTVRTCVFVYFAIARVYGVCVCMYACCATFVRGIARFTHLHTAYSPPYGPLRSRRVSRISSESAHGSR